MTYDRIEDIKQANRAAGQHWFDAGTMRFFQTRVHNRIYGGRYFVTSERMPNGDRVYTVRLARSDGGIETVGRLGQYASSEAAHNMARLFGAEAPREDRDNE